MMNGLFDRNYEELGSSSKGLILKNSGKVKVQWGKGFIDLINSNGKINVDTSKIDASIHELKELTDKLKETQDENQTVINDLSNKVDLDVSNLDLLKQNIQKALNNLYDALNSSEQDIRRLLQSNTNDLITQLNTSTTLLETKISQFQADWNEEDPASSRYVSNKPDIPEINNLYLDYDSYNKKIILSYNEESIAEIDATDFIKDGMVNGVDIIDGNLVITFNTDSGKQDISISLSNLFDTSNFYTINEIDELLDNKVDKESGKSLSSNDYTTIEKQKLLTIEENAQENVIENIKVNNNSLPINNKSVNISIPTKVSDLTNDAGYLVEQDIFDDLAAVAISGDYADIKNTPEIPDISRCIKKSSTAGLVRNNGTIDTNTYLTQHQDISGKYDKTGGTISGNVKVEGTFTIDIDDEDYDAGITASGELNDNLGTILTLQGYAGDTQYKTLVRNVATPNSNYDAANKKYVDNHVIVPNYHLVELNADGSVHLKASSLVYTTISSNLTNPTKADYLDIIWENGAGSNQFTRFYVPCIGISEVNRGDILFIGLINHLGQELIMTFSLDTNNVLTTISQTSTTNFPVTDVQTPNGISIVSNKIATIPNVYMHNIEIDGDSTTRIYTTIITSFATQFDVNSLIAYINNLSGGGFQCSGTVRTNSSGIATGRTTTRLVPGTSSSSIGILYHDTGDAGIAGPKQYSAGTGTNSIQNVIDTVIPIL